MDSFGLRLKRLREDRGLSQQELADKSGMHRFGIAKLEQGVRDPTWETVQLLADALGVDCTAFARGGVASAKPKGRPRKKKK
jgi:transcriptional regulator with XRE-family HTH domain